MRRRAISKLVPALALVLAAAGPVLAESASESMHEAGHSAGNAVSHTWQATKTATKDTDITAKVKLKLHDDKITKDADIHVKTVDGVVTLRGSASSEVASHAEQLARETTGVRAVRNRLNVTD
jgi:hyperosmotically inducible periplasmic protein